MTTVKIIGVHGQSLKPAREDLEALWRDALTVAMKREGKKALANWDAASFELIYYGDLIGIYSTKAQRRYDATTDLADHRRVLEELAAMKRKSFASRSIYERLPGRTAIREFIADVGQPLLRSIGLTDFLIRRFAPDYLIYWNESLNLRRELMTRIETSLRAAFETHERVIVLGHCLGSVATYEVFARADDTPHQVHTWLTFGSPLGDETVKKRIHALERLPKNVVNWINYSAEDDYICHDDSIADDFRALQEAHLVSHLRDEHVLNFAVRYGRSNPHHALGYLVHPSFGKELARALNGTLA